MAKRAGLIVALTILLILYAWPSAQARTEYYLAEKSLLFLSSVDARLFFDTLMMGDRKHILKVTKSLLDAGRISATDRIQEMLIEEIDTSLPYLVRVRLEGEPQSRWVIDWEQVDIPAIE
ncbi:MAG: hypothetical protein NTV99_12470 [Deltaproteobacteria bacterium]|nr:hypothetical protein [Deltaproteobacteria bacterium]